MPKWLKISLKSIAAVTLLAVLLLVGTLLYITYNKDKVLKMISSELNEKLDGQITIGDMKPQFFKHFPTVSLELQNVTIRDKRFASHHQTLLNAKEFYVSLNALSLITGKASINRIDIEDASADLYTDSTGYSNLSVFGKHAKKSKKTSGKSVPPELQLFSFSNLKLKVDDRHNQKLFYFDVNSLNGRMENPDSGWQASFHLDVLTKSMAFKTSNGSFIKNKTVSGDFDATGDDDGKIILHSDEVNIGPNQFKLDALFGANKRPADFKIYLVCDQISWRQASQLVSANIQQKLDQYNISEPVSVTARIEGSFSGPGDPSLYITTKVRDSKITTPVLTFDRCSLDGVFMNNYENGKGFTDSNSVIRFTHFTGSYAHLPFTIDTGSIANLNKPIAAGNFRANFPVANLNNLIGNKVARFTKGKANIYLRYKGDIVNYQLAKPAVDGYITIRDANMTYIPEKLKLTNSSLSLFITKNDLLLKNVRLQSGHSVITMAGRVKNFMNLYYTDPEKMLLILDIHGDQVYLGEFLGLLDGGNSKSVKTKKKAVNSTSAIDQLSNALDKGGVAMHLDVANLHYNSFLATNVRADVLTSEDAVVLKNIELKNSGGSLNMNGSIQRGEDLNKLALNTTISHVDVNEFFSSFNNFGLTDFTANNLRGLLSAKTNITAGLTDDGKLVKNSIKGTLDVNLQQGQLLNFKPIYSVGKFAFPFRDLKDIQVRELNAHFDVNGDMIKIYPMQFSSSAINMDVSGMYGLTKGTDLAIDVPLRNPKKDTTITDPVKLEKKRYKGIVLHLHAKADSTGKIKIGLGNDRPKD